MQGSLPAPGRRLDSSIAMEAYANSIALDNGGHLTPVAIQLQHPLESGSVCLDVLFGIAKPTTLQIILGCCTIRTAGFGVEGHVAQFPPLFVHELTHCRTNHAEHC